MRSIKIPKRTAIFVIGDIHEQQAQFTKLVEEINPSPERIIVSVGDVFDRGGGPQIAEAILLQLRELQEQGLAYLVRGNHESRRLLWLGHDKATQDPLLSMWLAGQPLSISFTFAEPLRLSVMVLHGGVSPHHNWNDLKNNSEIMYVRQVTRDGEIVVPRRGTEVLPEGAKLWHEVYDGRFGYIISGHSRQKDGKPKFYRHSCNVDTGCYSTGVLTAQEYNEYGLGTTIQVSS